MKKLITVLFACRLMILATSAQAQVAGHITTDTTWTDTVNIVGDVYVDNSVTLVIEPGTVVRLNGHYKIDVKGNIAASGTASDSITFTVADTTGFHNNTHVGWNRIIYDNVQQSNDSTIFRYCIFEYGKTSGNGGAMYLNNFYTDNDSTKLDISHCTFRKNYAQKGGAVYFWQYSKKSIVFKHNLITANKALNRGGGLYINFANTNVFKADFIDSCRILNNSVTNGNGGGICFGRDAKEGEMKEPGGKDEEKFKNIFRNCEIAYNSASAHGGGICSDNFTVLYQRAISLENCLIHHNTALGNGGGIWANEIVLKNCVIFENEAVNGGGLYGKEIYSVIVNNLIRDNIASGNGGGCVFKDNSEFADIANNTITGNHADNYGGGLFLDYSSPAFVNCIISGNEADNGGDNVGINDDPSDPGFSYCVLEGGRESIQGPGGGSLYTGLYYGVISRPARFVMTGGHPYQPAFNSPGIDDGNPDTTGMMLPQICMDGNPRIFDNTFDIIDIGCYESRFDTLDNYYFTGGHTDIDLAAYDTLGIGSSITFDSGLAFSTTEGAYIEFYGNYNLVFNKNIQVIGTEQGPITFTCYDTTGFYNHTHTGWNGIQLNNADIGATAEFSHCIFEYVKTEDGALSSSQIDSLFVDHCLFQYN
ncbi:MAG: right-handed parallel beta-helix repeat-containing protein, partial [Bacteroidales bacterium]|nr:right-handed parallel beta-helix repeat-containing protein [Bacteroidales bacterium]